jgi:hypothetical protein
MLDTPEAQILDGFAMVNPVSQLLVAGNDQAGALFLIDAIKRTVNMVLKDHLLVGPDDALPRGCNCQWIEGVRPGLATIPEF